MKFREKTAKQAKKYASDLKSKKLSQADQRKQDAVERRKRMQDFNKSVRVMTKPQKQTLNSKASTKINGKENKSPPKQN